MFPSDCGYALRMIKEAQELMAEALRRVELHESFSPAEIGKRLGLTQSQSEVAARALSDAGVLVLGFDCAASFTSDFRKARKRATGKSGRVTVLRHR